MEAAAGKMAEADKIAVAYMVAVAHMIAIVGKVLPRMIAAVRMMVADHRLRNYCYSHHLSASPPRNFFNQYTLKAEFGGHACH